MKVGVEKGTGKEVWLEQHRGYLFLQVPPIFTTGKPTKIDFTLLMSHIKKLYFIPVPKP